MYSLEDNSVRAILEYVTPEIPPNHQKLIDRIVTEVKDEFKYSMKKSSYELVPGSEPKVYPTPRPVDIFSDEFQHRAEFIGDNLFLSSPLVVQVLHDVFEDCRRVQNFSLVDFRGRDLKLPVTLSKFCEYQRDMCMKGIWKLSEYVFTKLFY